MDDLGCMNGWDRSKPEDEKKFILVYQCAKDSTKDHPHDKETKKLGTCWNEYICHTCKIRYNVDSSD